MLRQSIYKIAGINYVRSAIEEQADLSAFREKPTPLVLGGIFAIAMSYIIGWPAVAALSYISLRLQNPWIAAVGGPITYGLSHLVFLLPWLLNDIHTVHNPMSHHAAHVPQIFLN